MSANPRVPFPPFGGNSPTAWSPPWLGRLLINLRSIMIVRPGTLPGMTEQGRTTSAVRSVKGDTYGTKLFANWAAGLRAGVPVEGAMAYAPLTAGTDIGVPDPGSTLSSSGGLHRGVEQAPDGEQSQDVMVRPYTFVPGLGVTPGALRLDADGDMYTPIDRDMYSSDHMLQNGPAPDPDNGIAGSFRIPRQLRVGIGHMAGPTQWGPPFHWDGGPNGDTLMLRPPDIPATDGTNARAIRGVLGSARQSDTTHVPAVFTPQVIG